jgi:Na+/H+-dicarboxylate symporter
MATGTHTSTRRAERIRALAVNPVVVIGSLALGAVAGVLWPAAAPSFAFVGDVYVGLLKMTAMPFMVSAVIFSLQRMLRDGDAAPLIARMAVVSLAVSVFVVLFGALVLVLARPGAHLPSATLKTFGAMVSHDSAASETVMNLHGIEPPPKRTTALTDVLISLVPGNIFAALANGDTLKALVFSLFFGLATGRVPERVSAALSQSLETVYHTCQKLIHWFAYPAPIVLFCMSAAHLGSSGVGPLAAMLRFVAAFLVAALCLVAIAALVIRKRSGRGWAATLAALRTPIAMSLATRSSMACMPSVIDSLVERLGFGRSSVELLVPLMLSLLRIGPMVYYACATLFVAQLYGRTLGVGDLSMALMVSMLAGFASAGMSGIVVVSLIGMTCAYLRLPFEAAFVLFVAVDPLCDMLRTMLLVIGNTAAVCVICPRPSRAQASARSSIGQT